MNGARPLAHASAAARPARPPRLATCVRRPTLVTRAEPVYFDAASDDALAATAFTAGLAAPHISPFDAAALGVTDATLATLAGAYLAGKRKISVRDTAAAAQVPRAAALAWFRRVDALPPAARDSALAALVAAGEAAGVLQDAARARRERGRAEAAAREGPPPDWRAPKAVEKLSAAARATLDAVSDYFEGDWPPDDVLDGLWREARVPRAVAKEYFQSLAYHPGGGGASPAGSRASSPTAAAPSKGSPWTEAEHLAFINGLAVLGKGKWREIARTYVPSRTPTQVASHAQKHFIRLARGGVPARRRSRFSAIEAAAAVAGTLADPSLTVVGRGGPGGAAGLGALLAAASASVVEDAATAAARASPPLVRPIPRPASDVSLDKLAELAQATSAACPTPAAVAPLAVAERSVKSAFAPAVGGGVRVA